MRNDKHDEIARRVTEALENTDSMGDDYSIEELKKAIKSLKGNRSSLLVPAEMLKASPDFLLSALLRITNKIKNTCYFPHEWAKGITTLLHKDGDEDDPNNYRAITVADALSKVMTISLQRVHQ